MFAVDDKRRKRRRDHHHRHRHRRSISEVSIGSASTRDEEHSEILRRLKTLASLIQKNDEKLSILDFFFESMRQEWTEHELIIGDVLEYQPLYRALRNKIDQTLKSIIISCADLQKEGKKQSLESEYIHYGSYL